MMQILGIQIIGLVLAVLIFYEARVLYQRGKFKQRDFGIWSTVSIVLLIFSILPETFASVMSFFTNVQRGLDALLLIGLFGAYALVFQVYIRIQETNRQVTNLVKEVALKLEETEKK